MKKQFQAKFFYPCLLTLLFILLLILTIPSGCIYGSEGDWFSQHVALAEQFRQIFYETGRIFPDYTLLGSGSNIYDISYYGFLRPDVLISFLLPQVSMKYIISGYMILNMLAAVNLCFLWLKRHVHVPFFAFLGALLFSCGGFTYQAHHQIMFVNYLPFLFLALLGIDRLLQKGKSELLILSLFFLYLHSYYFSVSALFVCLLYFLYGYSLSGKAWKSRAFGKSFGKFMVSVLLSIGMAAILLLPTALDLLSTQKDAGTPAQAAEIFSVSLSFDSLLYSGYSCGLTLICLYTLLLSIQRKSTRILGILLLLCLTLNLIPYVLSGFLYIRYKVLIPLTPLLLLLCVQTLEELYQKKLQHNLLLLACCLLPTLFSDMPVLILADFSLMAGGFFLLHLTSRLRGSEKKSLKRKLLLPLKKLQPARKLQSFSGCLLLVVAPILVFLTVNKSEIYIEASDNRQELFPRETLSELCLDRNYRFDYLTTPFATVNLTAVQGLGNTNLYSSVTNSEYADYFYNTVRNPIRIRNRVALMTDANPFFAYLMGVRYIQTRPDYLPLGYEIIASQENAVIAENSTVLPVAYTSTSLMAQEVYEKLEFPYNLMALTNQTIVSGYEDTSTPASKVTSDSNDSALTPLPQTWEDNYSFSSTEESRITLPLSEEYKNKILILFFDVISPKGNEIEIDINGTHNKLSGQSAPYPNHNDCFTYILSDANGLTELDITFSKGTYSISNIHAFLADPECIGNDSVIPFLADTKKGNAILQGTAALEKNGYFVTSLPYRSGYQAYADGKRVTIENINDGFVGFPLAAGEHKISLYYSPPGKNAGMFLSLFCLLLFFILLEKEKRNTP